MIKRNIVLPIVAICATLINGCSSGIKDEQNIAIRKSEQEIERISEMTTEPKKEEIFSTTDCMDSIQMQRETCRVKDFIEKFHNHMLSFCPNQDFVEKNLKKGISMSDGSAEKYIAERKEEFYYAQLLEQQANVFINCDSIILDKQGNFIYYATERIDLNEKNKIMLYNIRAKGRVANNEIPETKMMYDLIIANWHMDTPKLRGEEYKSNNKDKAFSNTEKEIVFALREMIRERTKP